jgi:hypothetical protein
MKNTNRYRCKHCHKIVEREGDKKFVLSYCDASGKTTRLVRVDKK